MREPKISIIGATGNVGRQYIELLLGRGLVEAPQLHLFASKKSAGKKLEIAGHELIIHETTKAGLAGSKICIFNTEADISKEWIPHVLESGAYVLDSSSAYRLDPDVPLIIPPVNRHCITPHQKLYAHANCLASPIATVIAPLHQKHPVSRLSIVTFQSTSGAGKLAMDDCWHETHQMIQGNHYERKVFSRPIAFNVIPQVGTIQEGGMTSEEYKIINELKKVVDKKIAINATAVRVPTLIGHAISLNLELRDSIDISSVTEILSHAPSVKLSMHDYTTPQEVKGFDEVFVGRIRKDPSIGNGIQLWLCSDNLQRGAATDAVEITESLLPFLI